MVSGLDDYMLKLAHATTSEAPDGETPSDFSGSVGASSDNNEKHNVRDPVEDTSAGSDNEHSATSAAADEKEDESSGGIFSSLFGGCKKNKSKDTKKKAKEAGGSDEGKESAN